VKPAIQAAVRYLRRHPEELVRAARSVAALRVGIPLDALRWVAAQPRGPRAPRDVVIEAAPPGLRLSATVDLMGNVVRASGVLLLDHVDLGRERLLLQLRLRDVTLDVLEELPDSAVVTLLKSGALDLSKPGNLAAYMPRRPEMLVEAEDDRIVLDLRKHPKLADSARAQRFLELLMPVLTVRQIETNDEHLDLQLSGFPEGFGEAVESWRRVL
jgi:hypothetical protein